MTMQRREQGKGPDVLPILLEGNKFFIDNKTYPFF